MTRSFRALIACCQLALAQQPQPPVPQTPAEQRQPTTRQPVEAPPPPLAREQGAAPAPGTTDDMPVFGPDQPLLPRNIEISPIPPERNVLLNPYSPVSVPPIRTGNTPRLESLVRAGALYLTLPDAIALALENNIDLEIARYSPVIANWRLLRAEAGGALPGVPSNAAQAGAVAAGQGVTGSQAAAGVRVPGSGGRGGGSTNASIQQIGPVTQNLDPVYQHASTFSHTSNPQPNAVQSVTLNLISRTRAHAANFQQGLLSGGLVSVRYNQNYLLENSPSNILNPSTAANAQISIQHNLLRGFGIGVNARTIRVARAGLGISDLNFRAQVITVVNQVISAYFALAISHDQLRANRNVAEVADTFLSNVRRQIELGSVAPPEEINAQREAVNAQQQLVQTETTLRQQELRLKNLLSRSGPDVEVLRRVRIVPVDQPTIPNRDELPEMEAMVREALRARGDLALQLANFYNAQINALGTRNGLLPTLAAFTTTQNSGLAGTARFRDAGPGRPPTGPDPYFVGGIETPLAQIFRRNFPTHSVGAFFAATLNNRQASADYAIDQLQLRQNELNLAKVQNQVQVDLLNYIVAMQQARARYEAAERNVDLQRQLYEAENRRFQLGASTPYSVIQQQRDLVNAQSATVQALATYINAKVGLDQVLGRTLETNRVILPEAMAAAVVQPSVP
jgi:outer membrane protein